MLHQRMGSGGNELQVIRHRSSVVLTGFSVFGGHSGDPVPRDAGGSDPLTTGTPSVPGRNESMAARVGARFRARMGRATDYG